MRFARNCAAQFLAGGMSPLPLMLPISNFGGGSIFAIAMVRSHNLIPIPFPKPEGSSQAGCSNYALLPRSVPTKRRGYRPLDFLAIDLPVRSEYTNITNCQMWVANSRVWRDLGSLGLRPHQSFHELLQQMKRQCSYPEQHPLTKRYPCHPVRRFP